METLISTNSIQSVREVWWDVRPHPGFGTVELRICDGLPTLDEIGAVAALTQCLVEQFDTQLDRGYTLPTPAELDPAREQVAGGPLRPRRRHRRRREGHRPAGPAGDPRPRRGPHADGEAAGLRGRARRRRAGPRGRRLLPAAARRRRGHRRGPEGGRRRPARRDAGRPARHGAGRGLLGAGPGARRLRGRARGMNPVVEKLGSAVDDWVGTNNAQLVSTRRHLHAHPGARLRRVRDDVLPRAAAARRAG